MRPQQPQAGKPTAISDGGAASTIAPEEARHKPPLHLPAQGL